MALHALGKARPIGKCDCCNTNRCNLEIHPCNAPYAPAGLRQLVKCECLDIPQPRCGYNLRPERTGLNPYNLGNVFWEDYVSKVRLNIEEGFVSVALGNFGAPHRIQGRAPNNGGNYTLYLTRADQVVNGVTTAIAWSVRSEVEHNDQSSPQQVLAPQTIHSLNAYDPSIQGDGSGRERQASVGFEIGEMNLEISTSLSYDFIQCRLKDTTSYKLFGRVRFHDRVLQGRSNPISVLYDDVTDWQTFEDTAQTESEVEVCVEFATAVMGWFTTLNVEEFEDDVERSSRLIDRRPTLDDDLCAKEDCCVPDEDSAQPTVNGLRPGKIVPVPLGSCDNAIASYRTREARELTLELAAFPDGRFQVLDSDLDVDNPTGQFRRNLNNFLFDVDLQTNITNECIQGSGFTSADPIGTVLVTRPDGTSQSVSIGGENGVFIDQTIQGSQHERWLAVSGSFELHLDIFYDVYSSCLPCERSYPPYPPESLITMTITPIEVFT